MSIGYNNQLPEIIMPEYGRNIQNMVEYCKGLTDRDERNRCAHEIVRAMAALVPEKEQGIGRETIYWDHPAILADSRRSAPWSSAPSEQPPSTSSPCR